MSNDDFFIGWSPDTPRADRRFFLGAGLAMLAGTGGLGWTLASRQAAPGPGQWDQGAVREWRGIVTANPYAMLRTRDVSGAPQTVLLSTLGKCGVAARIGSHAGQPVVIRGSLIERGRHAMVAVTDDVDWIRPDTEALIDVVLGFPEPERLGEIVLKGEIVDSKCWFGAMRPSEGKVHKACAALCIRGGLPPVLLARDGANRHALLVLTRDGLAHGDDLLPFVADPVEISGSVYRRGEQIFLDGPVSKIRRLRA